MPNAIVAIHTASRQLGLDENAARDLYDRVTGKRSLRAMSEPEQQSIVAELRRLNGIRRPLEGRFAKRLQALWIAGWNLGLVEDRRDEALLTFARRQTGIDHIRFLQDAGEAAKVIEALKAWLARAAGVDWRPSQPAWQQLTGARIALAQWRIVHPDKDLAAFRGFVAVTARPVEHMHEEDWHAVMNTLGRRLRKLRAVAS